MMLFTRFDSGSREALLRAGVTTEAGAFEVLSRPGVLAVENEERCRMLAHLESVLGDAQVGALRGFQAPRRPFGVVGSSRGRAPTRAQTGGAVGHDAAAERAPRLVSALMPAVPRDFALLDYISLIRDQGQRGTCVGQAVAACLEFFYRLPRSGSGLRKTRGPGATRLSALGTYLMAKLRDGYAGEGTWQEDAWQAVMEYGCVPEAVLPSSSGLRSIEPREFARVAASYRIRGYLDLLLPSGLASSQPSLMRAVLSGQMPGLGPQPISISIAVTEAFGYRMAEETGRIAVLRNAPILGGHAMLCVGYYWDVGIEQYVFIVVNSWGLGWAAKSPVHPGCALIPEEYFRTPELVWELFTPITRASPASALGWLGSALQWGWDGRLLALKRM